MRQRLAAMGGLVAMVAHDLRNPLSVIASSVHMLRKRVGPEEATQRHLDKITRQVDACEAIITDLLDVARGRPPPMEAVALQPALSAAAAAVLIPDDIAISVDVPPTLSAHAAPRLLHQVLVNLVRNATEALAQGGGRISLRGRAEQDVVIVAVLDDGPGFAVELLPQAFDAMVTGRPGGHGLGLALVRTIAELHGGSATASNAPGGGACVEVRLLLAEVP